MEMILYLTPLDIYLKGVMVKSYVRNKELLPHDWSGLPRNGSRRGCGHILTCQETLQEFNIPDLKWDRRETVYHFDTKYQVDQTSFAEGEDITPHNAILCYTDGSRIDDHTGAGFCLYDTDREGAKTIRGQYSFHLDDYNTVYQAELSAILAGTTMMLRMAMRNQLPKETVILSDSMSSLMALEKPITNSEVLHRCICALKFLARFTSVTLRWIKAHNGYAGNELADDLAKAGAHSTGPNPGSNAGFKDISGHTPAPISYLTLLVEEGMERKWTERWHAERKPDGLPKYRQSKYFFQKPDKAKAYFLVKQDRATLGRTIQFITGHAFMRRHQNLVDTSKEGTDPSTPLCRLCHQGEETPLHLATECQDLYAIQHRFFGNLQRHPSEPGYQIGWEARKLLHFLEEDKVHQLLLPPSKQGEIEADPDRDPHYPDDDDDADDPEGPPHHQSQPDQ